MIASYTLIYQGFFPRWRRSGTPFGGLLETPLQQPHPKAALRKEKNGRGAAPPALAVHDVLARAVEDREHVAHFGEGHIDRPGQLVVLVFGRVAHIEPQR